MLSHNKCALCSLLSTKPQWSCLTKKGQDPELFHGLQQNASDVSTPPATELMENLELQILWSLCETMLDPRYTGFPSSFKVSDAVKCLKADHVTEMMSLEQSLDLQLNIYRQLHVQT